MTKRQRCIRWFEEIGSGDVGQVGGKNASLGEMIRPMKVSPTSVLMMSGGSLAAFPVEAQFDRDGVVLWHGTWGWGPMFFGALMMILFWAAVIALAVLLVRWLAGMASAREQRPLRSSALEILEERFARGEIGREEFEERRRVLISQPGVRNTK